MARMVKRISKADPKDPLESFLLRMPRSLRRALLERAEAEGTSANLLATEYIERALRRPGRKPKKEK